MNSPFQIERPTFPRRNTAIISPKVSKAPLLWGALAALLSSGIIAWAAGQLPGVPSPLQNATILPISDKIYVTSIGGPTQADARQLYKRALADLKSGDYTAALSAFKQLETLYPGLQDFLWLHEAESYAGQGNEWATQKKLNHLISQQPHSVLKAVARYRIGQSQVRGREWEKAEKTFLRIREDFPKSSYAIGSLYYLGVIANQRDEKPEQALTFLRTYLDECPQCKFSGEAADLLEKLVASPTVEDSTRMGLAEAFAGKDSAKTIRHLSGGNAEKTWLALGKALILSGKGQDGVNVLAGRLQYAKSLDEFREAVDLILANSKAGREAVLRGLLNKKTELGQDYLLWKLAEAVPAQAPSLYRTILNQYPESDYAPESGWNLLWPLVLNRNDSAYLAQAKTYIATYPYARSAPKALFWVGKLLEKSSPVTAKATYREVLQKYPTTYYAFRAKGRLKALEGQKDPGWPTLANRKDYPEQPLDLGTLDILPPAKKFSLGTQGHRLRKVAQELMLIGAVDDVKLLLGETLGDVPPSVLSWAEQTAGERAKGLRIVRDALERQMKEAFLASGKQRMQPVGTVDELKLLYPIYFSDMIQQAGLKNAVDPFLIQSLMREESYFNEFAISGSNARGLMQLLPSTAREVAGWEALSGFQTADLFIPAMNIRLGSRYLSFLHQQFNGNPMPSVGAYNGGPGAMKRWISNSDCFRSDPDLFVEKIPYEQSRDYIKKVFASYWNYTRLYAKPTI